MKTSEVFKLGFLYWWLFLLLLLLVVVVAVFRVFGVGVVNVWEWVVGFICCGFDILNSLFIGAKGFLWNNELPLLLLLLYANVDSVRCGELRGSIIVKLRTGRYYNWIQSKAIIERKWERVIRKIGLVKKTERSSFVFVDIMVKCARPGWIRSLNGNKKKKLMQKKKWHSWTWMMVGGGATNIKPLTVFYKISFTVWLA